MYFPKNQLLPFFILRWASRFGHFVPSRRATSGSLSLIPARRATPCAWYCLPLVGSPTYPSRTVRPKRSGSLKANRSLKRNEARGIVAEPPKPRSGEGDGADSPTQARNAGAGLAQIYLVYICNQIYIHVICPQYIFAQIYILGIRPQYIFAQIYVLGIRPQYIFAQIYVLGIRPQYIFAQIYIKVKYFFKKSAFLFA